MYSFAMLLSIFLKTLHRISARKFQQFLTIF